MICCQCGKDYQKDELVQFADGLVCPACKSFYVQKLKEGVPVGPIEQFTVRSYPLVSKTIWVIVGFCILLSLVGVALLFIPMLPSRLLGLLVCPFFAYLAWVGFDLVSFRHHILLIGPAGVKIEAPDKLEEYSWSELSGFRDRRIAQVVELFNSDGEKVFMTDYIAENSRKFRKQLPLHLEVI